MGGYIVLVVGESCSLEQLISRCFGIDDLGQFGLKWLKNNFLGDIINSRELHIDLGRNKDKQIEQKFIYDNELKEYRYYHPYMYKRKLTDEIIEKFDIGYDENTNCITFPVRDEKGNCLFVARRSVIGKYFNYPPMTQKPVYGVYELKKYAPNSTNLEVIVCESMINALTCWVYGKYAVALNGTGTPYQYNILKNLECRKLILALDPDEAGRKGTERLKNALNKYKIITILDIPEGKDVNDLSEIEFKNILEKF